MADEEIDITAALNDRISVPARTAAEETEKLAKEIGTLNRRLLLLDKRLPGPTKKLLEFAAAARAASGSTGQFNTQVGAIQQNAKQYQRSLSRLTTQKNKLTSSTKKATSAQQKFKKALQMTLPLLKRTGPALFMVAKGLALVGAVALAAGGVQGIYAFVAAAAPLVSLAAFLPTALFSIVAGFLAIKVATMGVSDGLQELVKDGKLSEETLKKLSPSAIKFLKVIKDWLPAFRSLRKVVQEEFFKPLAKNFGPALKNVWVEIQTGMTRTGAAAGKFFASFLGFFTTLQGKNFVQAVFGGAEALFDGLSVGVKGFFSGLSDMMVTLLPLWRYFMLTLGTLGNDFGSWLSEISSNGQLVAWIMNALQFLQTFADVARDVFTILKNVGAAMSGIQPVGLLALIDFIAQWTSSAEGMSTLNSIFGALSSILQAVLPLVAQLASVIATTLAPAIEPIVSTLAPAFSDLIAALAAGLQAMLPMWPVLAQGIAMVGQLLATILPVLGPLLAAIGQGLGVLLQVIGPPLIAVLQAILLPFQILGDLFQQYAAEYLPQILPLILQMVDGFAQFAPILGTVASMFSEGFAAVLPTILDLVKQIIPAFQQFVAVGLQNFMALLEQILPQLPVWIAAMFQLVVAFLQLFAAVAPLLPALQQILMAFIPLVPILAAIITVMARVSVTAINLMTTMITMATAIVTVLARVHSFITGTWSSISGYLSAPFVSAKSIIMGALDAVMGKLGALADKARSVMGFLSDLNPFRFAGGPVEANQKYTVGEIGKELFIPNSGGKPYLVGQYGAEERSFASSGTVVPSYLVDAMQEINGVAESELEAARRRRGGGGDGTPTMALLGASQAGETHHHETHNHNHFDFSGATFGTGKDDVEKQVAKALKKAKRDDDERR